MICLSGEGGAWRYDNEDFILDLIEVYGWKKEVAEECFGK